MLDSLQIAFELTEFGFRLAVDNVHATGYQHPSLDTPVFVKRRDNSPVAKQPLVIHPDYQQAATWGAIKALAASAPNSGYKNTNLKGFPKGDGTQSRLGIALDIADSRCLLQMLKLLGYSVDQRPQVDASHNRGTELMSPLQDAELTDTERDALIKARIGQSGYRDDLLAYWGGCAVTDCCVPELLRASHIKPWRAASPAERLDPFNGLLLTPNLDLAFDRGLISFDDQGQILLGEDLDPDSARALNINPCLRLRQIKPQHRDYLAWHREHLFRK
ncbi:HNH endonuclease [Pseudomonas guariconensis]|uniref:HNH endonuclease n=1 Tax=Pseudomonas guariconensis TaxID=1288410 RepID=UPI00209B7AFA|nr:HNH endonuclease signature motif containing protein [Pseudomonas guariconensis]MCO7633079.1 HNH endonuclease [Pseudomonas guariconensis]